ncbi:hypothetical protein [Engelhardtia mirabilis]|uniref:hypothetical protein n=1 Tax=Engelhardtia mirabilis TaxID=2528011 RepID=UPI0011A0B273
MANLFETDLLAPPAALPGDVDATGDGRRADLERGFFGRLIGGTARLAAHCAPLFVGGCLFAHIAWYGLRPALAERERLAGAAVEVHQRQADLSGEFATLERRRAALDDSFYRERLRRADRKARAAQTDSLADAGLTTGVEISAAERSNGALSNGALSNGAASQRAGMSTVPLRGDASTALPGGGAATDGASRRRSLVR